MNILGYHPFLEKLFSHSFLPTSVSPVDVDRWRKQTPLPLFPLAADISNGISPQALGPQLLRCGALTLPHVTLHFLGLEGSDCSSRDTPLLCVQGGQPPSSPQGQ